MKYAWAFERSVHSVRLMADFAVESGISYQTILKGTGLSQQQLLDPNMVVTGHQELQLIQNLVEQLGNRPTLGLEVGTRYHFTTFGPLGMALMSSASIREALDLALTYFSLTFAFTRFLVSDTNEGTLIEIDDEGIPSLVRQFIIERDAAALITVQRDLVQDNFCQYLAFSFEPAGNLEAYQNLFGVMPEFGSSKSFVLLDAQKINQKLQMANELVLHTAEEQCRQILDKRQVQKKFINLVQQQLMTVRGEMPSMEMVADRLHLNARTLRRHLASEGMTFIQIREEVRQVLAEQYLALPKASVEQIAEWLGYAEPASFIHAYKRWHGKTPHAMRLVQK
ncbi:MULTISPECIES: AraC family transcriptional regulator [Acinetobacter]|uniref:AraC family transcriptional regulator n=1 Tax=Acinetobacter TaxID=469 RepID=UPI00029C8FE2|nr:MULTISPECIES: AraC family transcriptional regulator [Acinetobacter]EKU39953.1 transcription regulator AraC N-terminal arabinose-binding domain protein [Acinetobacter sp. WC-141]MBM7141024.1 AraC family transcriptional regulator [Acinetobacter sp. 105-3]